MPDHPEKPPSTDDSSRLEVSGSGGRRRPAPDKKIEEKYPDDYRDGESRGYRFRTGKKD